MPVLIKKCINSGWKASENNRFGQVLELQFIDVASGKIMFRYAPLLKDEVIFVEAFAQLRRFDCKHKELMDLVKEIDGSVSFGLGSCERVQDVKLGGGKE